MSDCELDPSKLLGQEIRLCVERSRADENEFDEAEEEAIYWLIYDRVRHLGLRKHKMFGHIMLCLMPIAAATDDLDDLDELKIGRAACRERAWQYVYISVGACSIKKKNNH